LLSAPSLQAYFGYAERLNSWETLGCILVFGAVILSQLPDKKKTKQAM
jgi:drug/metabolite transporter (DMT)-like permease